MWIEANRWERHGSAYRLENPATEQWAGRVTGMFLLQHPRRHIYGWEWDSFSGWSNRVRQISWRCRSCARLRYSSEGGYSCPGILFRAFGNLPRPDLWLPYVFTSPEEAATAGVCELSSVGW